jgi:hypothetical protein
VWSSKYEEKNPVHSAGNSRRHLSSGGILKHKLYFGFRIFEFKLMMEEEEVAAPQQPVLAQTGLELPDARDAAVDYVAQMSAERVMILGLISKAVQMVQEKVWDRATGLLVLHELMSKDDLSMEAMLSLASALIEPTVVQSYSRFRELFMLYIHSQAELSETALKLSETARERDVTARERDVTALKLSETALKLSETARERDLAVIDAKRIRVQMVTSMSPVLLAEVACSNYCTSLTSFVEAVRSYCSAFPTYDALVNFAVGLACPAITPLPLGSTLELDLQRVVCENLRNFLNANRSVDFKMLDLSNTAVLGDTKKPDIVLVPKLSYWDKFHQEDEESVAWAGVSFVIELKRRHSCDNTSKEWYADLGQLLERMVKMPANPAFGMMISCNRAVLVCWKKFGDPVLQFDCGPPNGVVEGFSSIYALICALLMNGRSSIGHEETEAEEVAKLLPMSNGRYPVPLGFTSALLLAKYDPNRVFSHVYLAADRTHVLKVYRTYILRNRERHVLSRLSERVLLADKVSDIMPNVIGGVNHLARMYYYLGLKPCGTTDLQRYVRISKSTAEHLGQLKGILASVVSTLGVAHSLGFVHCDIKPSNIVLRVNHPSPVVVIDWEHAYIFNESDTSSASYVSGRTAAFCAYDQGSSSPTYRWDLESFLYTALYVLCHKTLPWAPRISFKASSGVDPENVVALKKSLSTTDEEVLLDVSSWSGEAQEDVLSLCNSLRAVYRCNFTDHVKCAQEFLRVLGEPLSEFVPASITRFDTSQIATESTMSSLLVQLE